MKTTLTRLAILLLSAAVLHLAESSSLAAQSPAAPMTIGVALPHGQLGDGAGNVSGALRQGLMQQLRRPGIEVVALDAASPEQIDAEARARHCSHVLYTNVQQKHGGGGLFNRLAPLASMLPLSAMAGGGRMGGGALEQVAQTAAQGAMNAQAASAQQQAISQLPSMQQSGIKRGDTVSVEYRLMTVGSSTPLKSATLQGKADADGQDVLTPLMTQLAGSIASPASGEAQAPSPATSSTSGTDPAGSAGGSSMLGGLFHRHTPPPQNQPTPGAPPDCAAIANMPNMPISADACQKMMGAQQAYNAALADPRASQPGDEQMSCDQILAELKQQQYTVPDKAKVAEGQATAAREAALLNKHVAEVQEEVVRDSATMEAASMADRATEAATMGVVQGRATAAAEKVVQAREKASNERMIAESKPTDTALMNITGDSISSAGQQLTANPRLARLTQLATNHHCHGG